jgi:hypothetical protein
LRRRRGDGTLFYVEDTEGSQLILETLFDMRVVLDEVRDVLIDPEDDDEEAEEEDA